MKLLLSLISWIIILSASAQSNSLLWKIEGNGLKKPSYLYGTMHLMDKRVFLFGDSVMVKFNECEALASEVVMDEVNPRQQAKAIMMSKDTTLKMLLSPEDYKLVRAKAKENLGFLAGVIDHVKPFYTSVLITTMKTEVDSTEALDAYFQKIAKRKGMKLIGIESIEEQFAAVDKISLKDQAAMLVSSLKEDEQNDQELNDLIEIYLSQDLNKLDSFVSNTEMPDMMSQSLLIERNHLMADRIVTIIRSQPTFIAIGAAHLQGKEGVISLLMEKEFVVTPVFSKYTGKEIMKDTRDDVKSEGSGNIYVSENPYINYHVWFPVNYIHEDDEKMIVAVNSKSGMIYTLSEEVLDNISSEKFFSDHIKENKESGLKVIKERKFIINGIPVMSVELDKEGMRIQINYYYLGKNTGVQLSVMGERRKIHDKVNKKFFYSLNKR